MISQEVTLGVRYVDRPWDAPQLGKSVAIGAGAKILSKITIGDCVKIGANRSNSRGNTCKNYLEIGTGYEKC